MKPIKIPRLFNAKKLSAATARRASAASAGMDFEGIPEPNMKLSRALLIVLLLHVVAVSGIIAFNAIKTRERSFTPAPPSETENRPADTAGTKKKTDTAKPRGAGGKKERKNQQETKTSRSAGEDEKKKKPTPSPKKNTAQKNDDPTLRPKK